MSKEPKLGTGERFKKLESKVKKEGYSAEAAKKIAASAGMKKWGKERMSEMAQKGKERKAGKK